MFQYYQGELLLSLFQPSFFSYHQISKIYSRESGLLLD